MRVRPRALGIYIRGVQFNEPQNPFQQPGMGEYIPGVQFNEPQNPFPASGMGCLGCPGMGQASADTTFAGIDLTSIGTSLSSAWAQISTYTIAGIPAVYLAGGAAALLLMMSMGSEGSLKRRAGRYSARARVLSAQAALKEQYPGIATRVRRRLTAAA